MIHLGRGGKLPACWGKVGRGFQDRGEVGIENKSGDGGEAGMEALLQSWRQETGVEVVASS